MSSYTVLKEDNGKQLKDNRVQVNLLLRRKKVEFNLLLCYCWYTLRRFSLVWPVPIRAEAPTELETQHVQLLRSHQFEIRFEITR